MKRTLIVAVLAALAVPASGFSQGIGLGVGTLVPQGELADGAKTGFAAIASLEIGRKTAVRIEGLWANSDLKGAIIKDANGVPVPGNANISGDVKVIGGAASLVFHLGDGAVRPYLLGGIGYYNRKVAQDAKEAASEFRNLSLKDSDLGFHGGLGVKLDILGVCIFGEARYHSVNTSESKTNFVPVLVGLRL